MSKHLSPEIEESEPQIADFFSVKHRGSPLSSSCQVPAVVHSGYMEHRPYPARRATNDRKLLSSGPFRRWRGRI